MVQREINNVRGFLEKMGGKQKKENRRLTSSFMLCLIKPNENSYPQMVSSFPWIMNPSSSIFLVPIQSSLTSKLTVVKLIEA